MPRILMYTTSYCPFCTRAKALLRAKGASFEEIDVESSPEKRREMVEKSGRNTVPQIWIDERHVGGCDDLMALDSSGQLDRLLAP